MKHILPFLTLLIALPLLAADKVIPGAAAPKAAEPESYYRSGEFNVDLYGGVSLKNQERDPRDLRIGGGLGATYFLTKNFGLGLRAESENTGHSVVDLALARVTLRAPLTKSFSPYGFVQGGFQFEHDRWEAGAGGGLEYRFIKNLGAFGEAGLAVDADGHGRMLGAAGIRLSF